jgi:hypothetical protein
MKNLLQPSLFAVMAGLNFYMIILPGPAQADPWDTHRECFISNTYHGPTLFCEEENEKRHRAWGRRWYWHHLHAISDDSNDREAWYSRDAATAIIRTPVNHRGGFLSGIIAF